MGKNNNKIDYEKNVSLKFEEECMHDIVCDKYEYINSIEVVESLKKNTEINNTAKTILSFKQKTMMICFIVIISFGIKRFKLDLGILLNYFVFILFFYKIAFSFINVRKIW